jgi:protein TonB
LVYPTLLRQAGIEGRVIIEAIIDTAGRAEPISIKVMSTANPGFNQSAMNYVLHAVFRPARIYGRAVRVRVQIPIDFNIYAH